jgi:hypothetical protein
MVDVPVEDGVVVWPGPPGFDGIEGLLFCGNEPFKIIIC